MRFHIDTRMIQQLPDSAFPFRLQYINRENGESLYDVTVEERSASIMLPILADAVTMVDVIITWPDGTIDEQTWKTTRPDEKPGHLYPTQPRFGSG